MTVAFTNCAAMRNLVTGRVVPQPAAQVIAKRLAPDLGMGLDLGMGPDPGMGSDRGTGPDKGRAGDSNVAASAAMFEPFFGPRAAPHLTAREQRPLDVRELVRRGDVDADAAGDDVGVPARIRGHDPQASSMTPWLISRSAAPW